MLGVSTIGWYCVETMLETTEYRAEQTEQAMLLDGSTVNINDAKTTMAAIYRAANRTDTFAHLDRLMAIRLWADDLQGLIDYDAHGESDTDYTNYKKTSVNETLASAIFELPEPDPKWTVPPRTAVAVLRNMVGIDTEDSGEIWLQEPFQRGDILTEVWESIRP